MKIEIETGGRDMNKVEKTSSSLPYIVDACRVHVLIVLLVTTQPNSTQSSIFGLGLD